MAWSPTSIRRFPNSLRSSANGVSSQWYPGAVRRRKPPMATMTQVRERPKARSSDQAEKMAFTIGKIGVIGAGQMGNGIAHVAALAGMDVLLNDISTDRINAGLATINGNLTRQV